MKWKQQMQTFWRCLPLVGLATLLPIAEAAVEPPIHLKPGFVDAYRAIYPDEIKHPGYTWTPILEPDDPTAHHDRIGFVYSRGDGVKVRNVNIVGENEVNADIVVSPYPSDHRAVVATFSLGNAATSVKKAAADKGKTLKGIPRADVRRNWPDKPADFRGFDSYQLSCQGRPIKVICPKQERHGAPWEWRGSFWGNKVNPNTEMTVVSDVKLLEAGYHVVIAGPGVPLGHPSGLPQMDAIYKLLTEKHGLHNKPFLMGLSRECLSVYRWASANPDKISGIYIDGGVCSLKSWPGGKRVPGSDAKGIGDARQWALAKQIYGFKSDAEALAYDKNPIDLLEPLAKAGVPLLHVAGLADNVVPYVENAAVLEERYKKLGGPIKVITIEGRGHVCGLEDPAPILEFMNRNPWDRKLEKKKK